MCKSVLFPSQTGHDGYHLAGLDLQVEPMKEVKRASGGLIGLFEAADLNDGRGEPVSLPCARNSGARTAREALGSAAGEG